MEGELITAILMDLVIVAAGFAFLSDTVDWILIWKLEEKIWQPITIGSTLFATIITLGYVHVDVLAQLVYRQWVSEGILAGLDSLRIPLGISAAIGAVISYFACSNDAVEQIWLDDLVFTIFSRDLWKVYGRLAPVRWLPRLVRPIGIVTLHLLAIGILWLIVAFMADSGVITLKSPKKKYKRSKR